MQRCPLCEGSDLYRHYHDTEWGVPMHEDRSLFELINLEGAQAGLSWSTILNKREHYRIAFDAFDPEIIARYDEKKVNALLKDSGIIRNKLKIAATIGNAKAYLALTKEGQTLNDFVWNFVDHKPIQNNRIPLADVPAKTAGSDAMSKALQKIGFKFVGSTICYAFMQASGMVNDHLVTCHQLVTVQSFA